MFDRLLVPPGDALHAVMARFRADPRPGKIDLGVGVYRDETGASPVMRAVREAERIRIERQDTKAYQALAGDHVFIEERTVDVHVLRLRKALKEAESLIRTVRSVGYMLSEK